MKFRTTKTATESSPAPTGSPETPVSPVSPGAPVGSTSPPAPAAPPASAGRQWLVLLSADDLRSPHQRKSAAMRIWEKLNPGKTPPADRG